MAVSWVWAGGDERSPDPMISYAVGDGKTNETTDVYLVKALLNLMYGVFPQSLLPPLPVPGTAWDDATVAYVAEFQTRIVGQRKVTGVVSPAPVGMSYQSAIAKKYTIAHMIRSSLIALSFNGDYDNVVAYLTSKYPDLKPSLRTVRNGNLWTQDSHGTSEDFHSGGDPGIVSGRTY